MWKHQKLAFIRIPNYLAKSSACRSRGVSRVSLKIVWLIYQSRERGENRVKWTFNLNIFLHYLLHLVCKVQLACLISLEFRLSRASRVDFEANFLVRPPWKVKWIFRTFPFFFSPPGNNHANIFHTQLGGEKVLTAYGSPRAENTEKCDCTISTWNIFQTSSNIQRKSTAPKQHHRAHQPSTPNLGKCAYVYRSLSQSIKFLSERKARSATTFHFASVLSIEALIRAPKKKT